MLSEEEKIVIIQLQSNRDKLKENFTYTRMGKRWLSEDIDKALNLIEKQNKIIDKMAEDNILLKECGWLTNITNKQDTIEFYTKLVEEEN